MFFFLFLLRNYFSGLFGFKSEISFEMQLIEIICDLYDLMYVEIADTV